MERIVPTTFSSSSTPVTVAYANPTTLHNGQPTRCGSTQYNPRAARGAGTLLPASAVRPLRRSAGAGHDPDLPRVRPGGEPDRPSPRSPRGAPRRHGQPAPHQLPGVPPPLVRRREARRRHRSRQHGVVGVGARVPGRALREPADLHPGRLVRPRPPGAQPLPAGQGSARLRGWRPVGSGRLRPDDRPLPRHAARGAAALARGRGGHPLYLRHHGAPQGGAGHARQLPLRGRDRGQRGAPDAGGQASVRAAAVSRQRPVLLDDERAWWPAPAWR